MISTFSNINLFYAGLNFSNQFVYFSVFGRLFKKYHVHQPLRQFLTLPYPARIPYQLPNPNPNPQIIVF